MKTVKLPKGKTFEFKKASGGGETKYPWDAMFKPSTDEKTRVDLNGKYKLPEGVETGNFSDLIQISKGTEEQVAKGEADYTVETDAMGPKIKTAARKRYKVCSVSSRDFEGNKLTDSLILQARDMTPEERTIEDAKRAEEKIKRAEKKAEEKANAEPTETTAAA